MVPDKVEYWPDSYAGYTVKMGGRDIGRVERNYRDGPSGGWYFYSVNGGFGHVSTRADATDALIETCSNISVEEQ